MQLLVRSLDGRTTPLCMDGTCTVAAFKAHLEAIHGVPVCEQLLTANGRVLVDEATLAGSGLQADSTVQLLLRLCGGKGGFGALLRGQGRDGKITDNFDACRDLSGRRIRHVDAEKKLKDWQKEAKERELEELAMKHMKEMAKQAKRDRDFKVNVEEVKRQHKEAADAVVEAVHTALAEGLQQQAGANGRNGSSMTKPANGAAGSSAAAAADGDAEAAGSPAAKRKASDGAAAAGAGAGVGAANGSSVPAKKRKTMLDLVEGDDSDDGSDDDSEDEA